ncbi:DctP family TRAP transporter solute-binding subunit [Blastochloris viridis]|uniref:Extracytoplasmic solute receptor protein yiaO n=1 Tax=Blastochloris viridis TaxID=1079 RepID=A0A0H5BBD4_BLAVI|nr:DctP family TRAP transporter solute-binding subunit [Blastochloris viridis]ALK08326.1 2,3-diketo-L-gulonate-binding periplasmic protein YiaO precursor [Blastochloris viridis]BAR98404.1 TRAP-type transport system [Blastochloris viridis]CUU44248.1 Extracytoplasmic solute receptor protein yiaO [Blastochloris viridis]
MAVTRSSRLAGWLAAAGTAAARVVLAAVGALAVAALPASAQTTLTIQHPLPLNSHYGAGASAFKDAFERLTDGRYRVVVQRNDNEREMMESLQIGTLDFSVSSTGPVGNFVPESKNLDVPFLFRDTAHARGVLDGDIGNEILAAFERRGLTGVIWLENGFRHLTNSRRPVVTPDDIKGLKIRTMENQVHMRAFETLGALPTPMTFSEIITALQQGTVDGQENPITVIVSNNLDQVQKYLSLTGHVYSPAVLVAAPATVARFSAADRAAMIEAARAAQTANRDRVSADEATGVAELRRRGMSVVTDIDRAKFEAALAPAYAVYAKELDGNLIARIRAAAPSQ